jgi:hypothetical protein|tara:strand:- start:216 stop:758 length:543 start_codon:yes stop_codon:yes gene_type:complete
LSENNESHLVPGRECGECTACCVHLLIKDDDFVKPENQACSHMVEKGGCNIYSKRPSVCQDWHCAWRFMAQLGDDWRPDRSGILLRSDENGIIFQPIREAKKVMTSSLAIELIGGGVAQGIPLSMSIPTRKGHLSYGMSLNEPLQAAVESRSLPAIQNKIIDLIKFSKKQRTDSIIATDC